MKALEAIITASGVRVVEIRHTDQAAAVVRCKALGLDPYATVPDVKQNPALDTMWMAEQWQNHLDP